MDMTNVLRANKPTQAAKSANQGAGSRRHEWEQNREDEFLSKKCQLYFKFSYLTICVTSSESDINMHQTKVGTAIDHMKVLYIR